MRNIIALLLTVLLFLGISYFLFTTSQPPQEVEVTPPPLEVIDPPPPLTVIEADPPATIEATQIAQDAEIFVETLNKPQDIPIIISNDQGNFVRHDSDIILMNEAAANSDIKLEQAPMTLKISDIIKDSTINKDDIFYLHHVTEQDSQGLWGIIQRGLVEKFRTGLTLEGISTNRDTLQVIIPADADERLTNGLSSFLGKLLSQKVHASYIYNLDTKIVGRNPNLIQPGQQLVLIKFTPDELKSVYQFFAEQRQQAVQTYGIPD